MLGRIPAYDLAILAGGMLDRGWCVAQKVRFCFVLLKNARGLFFLHEFAFSQQTLVRYCVEGVGRHAAPRRLLLRGASRPGGLQPLIGWAPGPARAGRPESRLALGSALGLWGGLPPLGAFRGGKEPGLALKGTRRRGLKLMRPKWRPAPAA